MVWHEETDFPGTPDLVDFAPGGFSYGDYLRSGGYGRPLSDNESG